MARGTARFTLDSDTFTAPAGTYVFVREPEVHRHAVAEEAGTTVLSFGGTADVHALPVGVVVPRRGAPHAGGPRRRARGARRRPRALPGVGEPPLRARLLRGDRRQPRGRARRARRGDRARAAPRALGRARTRSSRRCASRRRASAGTSRALDRGARRADPLREPGVGRHDGERRGSGAAAARAAITSSAASGPAARPRPPRCPRRASGRPAVEHHGDLVARRPPPRPRSPRRGAGPRPPGRATSRRAGSPSRCCRRRGSGPGGSPARAPRRTPPRRGTGRGPAPSAPPRRAGGRRERGEAGRVAPFRAASSIVPTRIRIMWRRKASASIQNSSRPPAPATRRGGSCGGRMGCWVSGGRERGEVVRAGERGGQARSASRSSGRGCRSARPSSHTLGSERASTR